MKCRYCNIGLAPLRSLTDGEFCCDDHRYAFREEQAAHTEVSLEPLPREALFALPLELSEIPGTPAAPIYRLEPREFKPAVAKPVAALAPWVEEPEVIPPVGEGMLPLHFAL